jgi:hypothetical protein
VSSFSGQGDKGYGKNFVAGFIRLRHKTIQRLAVSIDQVFLILGDAQADDYGLTDATGESFQKCFGKIFFSRSFSLVGNVILLILLFLDNADNTSTTSMPLSFQMVGSPPVTN